MSQLNQRLANLSPAKRKLLEQRLKENPKIAEPIAVVGMSCRLPGARNLKEFWRLISQGLDATGEIPSTRWDIDGFYDPSGEQPGKMSVRWAGLVEGEDQFDPMFFGIAPREAAKMDPQQRLLLEVSWEALEYGGLSPERLSGSATGVYVGIGGTDYSKVPIQFDDYYHHIDAHVGTGNALSIASNRVSYVFNLRGPSLSVDTACSSGIVAVHLAVQSLRRGECDAALAGGVNMILSPETTIAFSKARMLSPDGKCRPFDVAANGYVRGEGCVMIAIKRLTDAVADGDRILAVLRNTALNQDGKTSGITAPNSQAQVACIRAALAGAGLTPDKVNYVEAHGTGTPLGDPIEVQALSEIFRDRDGRKPPLYMASVKGNIGHTETVSGMASLVKVILMMQHGVIAPQANFKELNPNISLAGTRLRVPTELTPWQPEDGPRIAGVSSFGFGGTNTHVVLEEAAPVKPARTQRAVKERPLHMLAVSAKTETALRALAGQYAEDLASRDDAALADFCYTANSGRSHFNHRLAIAVESREQLRARLAAVAAGESPSGVKLGQVKIATRPKVAFLFTGQGSQYVHMARQLYETEPTFRSALNQCDEILRDELDVPLLSVLYPQAPTNGKAAGEAHSPLDQTAYTQPALFAVEYSLAAMWKSWGLDLAVALGHSVGEYVAACLAGVFNLEDGLRLVALRARLMQRLPSGGQMAVVFAPIEQVAAAVALHADRLSVAAHNGPQNTVISGAAEAVQAVVSIFEHQGVRTQMLTVSHAFHSPLMDPMLDEFEREAAKVAFRRPLVPLVSNLTGKLLTEPPTARYWRDHIRGTVRFVEGVQALGNRDEFPLDAMLEVGPTPHLLPNARRALPQLEAAWLPSLRQGQDDWRVLLATLADLYVLGVKVDWKSFDAGRGRRPLALPTYPFERSRHWFTESKGHGRRTFGGGSRGPVLHPLLGSAVPSPLEQRLFEVQLSGSAPAYLKDHQVQGSPVTPAAAYVEQALAAADQVFGSGPHLIENLVIQQAMFLPESSARAVQMTVSPESGGECTFETYSIPADGEGKPNWTMHACGRLRHAPPQSSPHTPCAETGTRSVPATFDLTEIRSRVAAQDTREVFYQQMASRGLAYGPAFQVLDEMCRTDRDALAAIRLPQSVAAELKQYHLHPALLDGCFQAMAGIVPLEADGSYSPYTYMPTGVRRVCLHAPLTVARSEHGRDGRDVAATDALRIHAQGVPPGEQMFTYAVRTSDDTRPSPEYVEGDVYLLNEGGEVLLELSGVRVTRVGRAAASGQKEESISDWLYRIRWQPQPVESESSADSVKQAAQQGTWLIFADQSGVGAAFAEELRRKHGQAAILVTPGEQFAAQEGGTFAIDPLASEDYARLLGEAFGEGSGFRVQGSGRQEAGGGGCCGVIHLWSLDIPLSDDAAPSLAVSRRLGCGSALQLIRELARTKVLDRAPSLWLVTRGAQDVSEVPDVVEKVAVGQSPLWGLGRVAAIEHPELHCRLVDLDATEGADAAASQLAREVVHGPAADAAQDENQVAYRAGQRRVARLVADPDALPAETGGSDAGLKLPAQGAYQLRVGKTSGIDNLHFASFTPCPPEAGQVEIEVRAAGLNFSDVLKAMGLYPGIRDQIVPLGIECSGVVTAVGEGVTRLKVGDEVFGVAPYSFASHVRTAEYALVQKPMHIDDAEACTIPITFLTAYYALRRLADLQPGERVLIHAGAGGVGLAAIQIAQQIGAEIFCTAGSDEKRNYLRSLGVPHILNSRSLAFADEIMKITNREGVDVVLNSLPGDFIAKSLGVLRAYGRFLEIGKIDIYANRMVGLSPFQDNLSYFAIDLDRMLRQRPDYIRGLFAEVMEHFASADYRPLAMTKFAIDDVAGAFRYMAQRKNTGKVVVEMDRGARLQRVENEKDEGHVENVPHQDGSCLITGGLGALGLQVAEFLAGQGASHLVLLGRRAPSGELAEKIKVLETKGAKVAAIQGDVADRESLAAALRQIPAGFPPLRGVIHAAGVLADGVMFDMGLDRLDKAMAPKMAGTWNLHALTADLPLDFFVLFSSVACVLGSPGQANYAAGNAFLDALCSYRHALGLPAASINWGPWAGSGMAAEGGRDAGLSDRGMNLLPADRALALLGRVITQEQKLPPTAVMSVRWADLLKLNRGPTPPMLREVVPAEGAAAAAPVESAADKAFRQQLITAGIEDREQLLRDFFAGQLAHIMGLDTASIDTQQPLNTLGLDSLMAIELKINIETRLKITLPMSQFMESPSVTSLAKYVAKNIGDGSGAAIQAVSGGASDEGAGASLRTSASHTGAQEWNPLVALQPAGDRPPLWCLHPAGGNVLCYEELARQMGKGQPVYALQARGADGIGEPHTSIDEMVNDYLAAVRGLQPSGPYYFAAWSSGGPVAYEMAYRLKQQGDEIGLLALMDSWPSLVNVDLDDDARFLCELANFFGRFYGSGVQLNYDELSRLDREAQLAHVLRQAEQHGVVSGALGADAVRRFLNLCKANLRIMMHNQLQPCELPVHFFRAATGDLINEKIRQDAGHDYGWGELVGSSVVVREVPGDHITMLTGDNAAHMARLLRESMQARSEPVAAK